MNRWLAGIVVSLGILGFAPLTWANPGSIDRALSGSIGTQRLSLNGNQAKAETGKALGQRYGKNWRKGTKRVVNCKQFSSDIWRCRVSWKSGNSSYGGYVKVVSSDTGIETHVHVKRH